MTLNDTPFYVSTSTIFSLFHFTIEKWPHFLKRERNIHNNVHKNAAVSQSKCNILTLFVGKLLSSAGSSPRFGAGNNEGNKS